MFITQTVVPDTEAKLLIPSLSLATFYPAKDGSLCANMKKTTLPKVLAALQDMKTRIVVPPEVRRRALGAIEKMISL